MSAKRRKPPASEPPAKPVPGVSAETRDSSDRGPLPHAHRAVSIIEWITALLLTAAGVAAHLTFLFSRGGMWRDEVQIVNISNMPTFAELWAVNEHDTFPLVWQMLVRGWTAIGLGGDTGLDVLGCLVGLGILSLLWWNAWRFDRRVPLLSLVLVGLCPTVIRYGDSLRGYGCGTLAMLLMLAAVWEMLREPRKRTIALGLAASVLAVQTMYFNAVLLLALGAAGTAITVLRRSLKPMLAVGGVGIVAALSIIPYYDTISRQYRWNAIVKYTTDLSVLLGQKFPSAVAVSNVMHRQLNEAPFDFMIYVWVALGIAALAGCVWRMARPNGPQNAGGRVEALFVGVALVAGFVGYFGFLVASRLPTWPWYYVCLISYLGVLLDHAAELATGQSIAGRIARLVVVLGLAAAVASGVWRESRVRMSNTDLIAAKLEAAANENDLILITPWWPRVSFQRYYHGKAPVLSLPELGDYRLQRFDFLRDKMSQDDIIIKSVQTSRFNLDLLRDKAAQDDPMTPVWERIYETLASGHKLWIVGGLASPAQGQRPVYVPPLPKGALSDSNPDYADWARRIRSAGVDPALIVSEGPYLEKWSQHTGVFLSYLIGRYNLKVDRVPIDTAGQEINFSENTQVLVVEGPKP